MEHTSCKENEHTLFTTNVGGGILRHTCVRCSLVSIEPVSRHDIASLRPSRSRPALRRRVVGCLTRDYEQLPQPAA